MGFFNHLQSKGGAAVKPQIAKVKKEPAKSEQHSTKSRSLQHHSKHILGDSTRGSSPTIRPSQKSDLGTVKSILQQPKPRSSITHKRSRVFQSVLSSSEESDAENHEGDEAVARKRSKIQGTILDTKRRLRAYQIDNKGEADVKIINAADIAPAANVKKYKPAFHSSGEVSSIDLSYPGQSTFERYELVNPLESEGFNPIEDIVNTVEVVSKYYLTPEDSHAALDESSGVVRLLRRSVARDKENEFRQEVSTFNDKLQRLNSTGSIAATIDQMLRPPLPLVEHILTQTYARTVSPKVEMLRKYENGTDNVYGELLPRFISVILSDSHLTSDQIFVDLGSGVANVVLQAALEVGCESWGCEMMENACALAELQETEFKARCGFWGISPGETHLERGDFLVNTAIGRILRKADVVLVNNQAFTPQLNDGLVNLFLDLKEGCQIISLKSFVPSDHKITARNINSPVNLLDVKQKTYYSNCVSWTNAPGTYFMATKDSSRLQSFERQLGTKR